MKKALAIILDYFVILAASCIAGILIYTAFFNCTTLIAGETVNFTKEILIYGFFETFPIVLMLMNLVLIIYKIRHKASPIASAITYIILTAITWLLFYPLSLTMERKIYSRILSPAQVQSKKDLSSGYFRTNGGSLYYFIDNKDNMAQCLTLRSKDSSEPFFESLDVSPLSDFAGAALPFREPLIKDAMSDIPYGLINIIHNIKLRAALSWRTGYFSWILFCSFGLLLASVYMFIRISEWRLVTTFFTVIFYTSIIIFNVVYFLPQLSFLSENVNSVIIGTKLQKYFIEQNQDFLLTFINTASAVLILLTGTIINIIRGRKN